MRLLLGFSALVFLTAYPTGQAQAESPPHTVRLTAGVGRGNLDYGLRFGVEAEYWLTRRFAIGGRAIRGADTEMFNRYRRAYVLEPQILASIIQGEHWNIIVGGGMGMGHERDETLSGFCPFNCVKREPVRSMRLSASGTVGALFYAGPFAFSSTIRIEGMGHDLMSTANLGIGARF